MITSILRNFTGLPSIVFIRTTDDLSTITATSYIVTQQATIDILNNGEFIFESDDYCLISYSGGEGWFSVDFSTNTFVQQSTAPGLYQLQSSIISGITTDVGGSGAGPASYGVPQLVAGCPIVAGVMSSSNGVGLKAYACDVDGNFRYEFTADPGASAFISLIALTAPQNFT